MRNKSSVRDGFIVIAMLLSALTVQLNPVERKDVGEKRQMPELIPISFVGWSSRTYDTADYTDKWQSINELLVRTYSKRGSGFLVPEVKTVDFVLEYSSDVRNNFSFHFPENCHRAAGNEIEIFQPLDIKVDDSRTIKAKTLFIKGHPNSRENKDKIVAYWLVIDNKHFYRTFLIKLDQMLSGLLRRPKSGFLLRIDYHDNFSYSPENIKKANKVIAGFVRDLYAVLDEDERLSFFGEVESRK